MAVVAALTGTAAPAHAGQIMTIDRPATSSFTFCWATGPRAAQRVRDCINTINGGGLSEASPRLQEKMRCLEVGSNCTHHDEHTDRALASDQDGYKPDKAGRPLLDQQLDKSKRRARR
jgi:hypothetical protein